MFKPSVFRYTNPSGQVVWKVDVQTGKRPNGKPIVTRRTAPTKSEAVALGQRMQLEAAKGQLAPEGREHFRSFAIRWLTEVKAPQVRVATAQDYLYKLNHFILPTFGERPIRSISASDVAGFFTALQKQGLSNYSVNGIRQVLHAVMKGAVAFGLIGRNPVESVPRLRQSRRTTVFVQEPWTVDEAQSALAAISGTSVELFGHLLIYLGLRKSEALGLQWRDFDFDNGTVTINRSVREVGVFQPDGSRKTQVIEEEPKTVASHRTLLLSRPLLEAVFRHRQEGLSNPLPTPTDWVLATRTGSLPRPSNLQRRFNQLLKASGVRRIRIHDIRHSAIVMALEAGTPIEAVSQGAGHSRLDTTKSIYAPYSQNLANRFSTDVSDYLNRDNIDVQLLELLEQESQGSPGLNDGME